MTELFKQYPGKIRTKIFLASLLPLAVVIFILGAVTYRVAVINLDKEFGKRLIAMANLTANQLDVLWLESLAPGDENSRIYRQLESQLNQIKGLEEISVITVFDRNNLLLLDTEGAPIGEQYGRFYLDREEIEAAGRGDPAASVTFTGKDGQIYKTGYAPMTKDGETIAIVGIQGSPGFYEGLRLLKQTMLVSAVSGFLLAILLSLFIAGNLVRPIRQLVRSAEQIGRGEIDKEIKPVTGDELGLLAHTINDMRMNLLERDMRMQMMMRGVAHEIKNPLGGMKLFIDLIGSEVKDNLELTSYVKKVDNEITSLTRLVNEFLDFTKESAVEKKSDDLRRCIDEVVIKVKARFIDKPIELKMDLPEEIICSFDQEKMNRAFYNILENAFQAVKGSGEVTIEARREKNKWEIIISDNGIGIVNEEMEKIFKPFYSTKEKGTGLGLAFVKKIVEGHEGELWVKSAPGQGTRVEIGLPVNNT